MAEAVPMSLLRLSFASMSSKKTLQDLDLYIATSAESLVGAVIQFVQSVSTLLLRQMETQLGVITSPVLDVVKPFTYPSLGASRAIMS